MAAAIIVSTIAAADVIVIVVTVHLFFTVVILVALHVKLNAENHVPVAAEILAATAAAIPARRPVPTDAGRFAAGVAQKTAAVFVLMAAAANAPKPAVVLVTANAAGIAK
ncbi:hypothetical protein NO1_1055 [Candidatus Termititenax aidoneus]|uniref:Uncharacterized protein n=1 Tax=Termititenax aidoneus TaxID=2218524 RepID=A0A388TD27_TERA1|nr:hypothetical protein NO1_1055 [Candidatus Termititenax aidoneus]